MTKSRTMVLAALCVMVPMMAGCTDLVMSFLGLGSTASTSTLTVVVHNFHNNAIQAVVTYSNTSGAQQQVIIDADGVSPIPTQSTGAEEITFSEIGTDLTVTFSFPNEAGVADVQVVQALGGLAAGNRLRFAVTGNTAADITSLIE